MSFLRVGQTFDQLVERVSELESENRGLADDLRVSQSRADAAEASLQGAQAMVRHYQTYYSRTGW